MIRNPRARRASAIVLILLGTILMFFATEVWQGALLFALGVLLEVIGVALEHKAE